MNRLEQSLRAVRDRGEKALIPFLTGSCPDRSTFIELLKTCEACGCPAVEVGVPFSDPSADGQAIQLSSQRALAAGVSSRRVLDDVARAREEGLQIPLVLMTYYNPVLARGVARFVDESKQAKVDGLLLVDVPMEEAAEVAPLAREAGLDTIFLVAPTTPPDRLERIAALTSGFAYCVSVAGVTGGKRPTGEVVERMVSLVRQCTDIPVMVGFGIDGARSAQQMSRLADGVIVGSALMRILNTSTRETALASAGRFLTEIREAQASLL